MLWRSARESRTANVRRVLRHGHEASQRIPPRLHLGASHRWRTRGSAGLSWEPAGPYSGISVRYARANVERCGQTPTMREVYEAVGFLSRGVHAKRRTDRSKASHARRSRPQDDLHNRFAPGGFATRAVRAAVSMEGLPLWSNANVAGDHPRSVLDDERRHRDGLEPVPRR